MSSLVVIVVGRSLLRVFADNRELGTLAFLIFLVALVAAESAFVLYARSAALKRVIPLPFSYCVYKTAK